MKKNVTFILGVFCAALAIILLWDYDTRIFCCVIGAAAITGGAVMIRKGV